MATATMSTQTKKTLQSSAKQAGDANGGNVWLARLMTPLGSSLLLWLCFFPVAWGFLAWAALVPLLCLVRQERSLKSYFWLSYLAGLGFFVPILQWMRVADWRMNIAWLMLAIYCAVYFPIAMMLIRRIDRTKLAPLWISVPIAWVGMEWVRSWMISGFAWYYLGHSQHRFLEVIQIADLGGVYLISILVAAVNGLFVEALYRRPAFRQAFRQREPDMSLRWLNGNWRPVLAGTLLIGAGLTATLIYGTRRLAEDDFVPGPRIALLQGNVDQRLRNQAMDPELHRDAALSMEEHYRRLYPLAFDLTRKRKERMPELVIWPETSYPAYWVESNPNIPVEKMPPGYKHLASEMPLLMRMLTEPRGRVSNLDQFGKHRDPPFHYSCPTNHLIGMNGILLDDNGEEVHHNMAVLIDKTGRKLGRYEKVHPVPFGEYIPFKKTLPFMTMFSPYGKDWPGIEPGTELTRFTLDVVPPRRSDPVPFHFGVLICYEDTDPLLARQYALNQEGAPRVDFLVNMSNDGWFDGTSEHEEHLAISRFRAIEARRALVRSVNMGISAVIDSNGRVQKPMEYEHPIRTESGKPIEAKLWMVHEVDGTIPDLPVSEWSGFKKVDGVIHATIPIDSRPSLYSVYGDWPAGVCWGLIGLFLLVSLVRRPDMRTEPGAG